MNFIHRLKAEGAAKDAAIKRTTEELDAFVAFLHTAKFVGTDDDGSRKDWISTRDVLARMAFLRESLEAETVGR